MQKIIYLDHAATTGVDENVLKDMMPFFSMNYGNASSVYSIGRISKRAIDEARGKVARVINAKPKEIYFTSCGSESDNLALKGVAYANREKGNHIITTKIEHPAILNTCKTLKKQGFNISYLNVDNEGFINLEELKRVISDKTILISVMFANNEIGTIQNIKEIGRIAKERNIIFHTDAVQAIGNVRIAVQALNIDMLSMSAHKFYGPKGMGALYVRDGVNFERIQDGGHQEKNKRAGTENVAGIVGIGSAIELAYKYFDYNNEKISNLRNYFIYRLKEINCEFKINGSLNNRLPGNANISFKGVDGTELLYFLDEKRNMRISWFCMQ